MSLISEIGKKILAVLEKKQTSTASLQEIADALALDEDVDNLIDCANAIQIADILSALVSQGIIYQAGDEFASPDFKF